MTEESWRKLVDVDQLSQWMDTLGLESGTLSDFLPLTGGTQNLLLRFKRGARQFVLRRPPLHTNANSAITMQREARILGALATTDIPHSRLIASCDDETVLGAYFYLMEPVDGYTAVGKLPESVAGNSACCHQLGLSMVDAIASLGEVDFEALGLADFGKSEGYLERQSGRWKKQFDSYNRYPGWSGTALAAKVEKISSWLTQNCPKTFTPGIVHGDYHLANVMFCYDQPRLAAIVDWELCTIGDPLIDLGWLITTWPNPEGKAILAKLEARPWVGFATVEELINRYAQRSNRDLSQLNWYIVLACYKLGIILEGTYARACAGKAPADTGAALHQGTLTLMDKALRWMQTS
ncbi:MAG: phosphotransferase family protein [Gammaproteobacteria bacterium]|nr:phosphotransferase family protein [Gammaproteobacteria bacterium]